MDVAEDDRKNQKGVLMYNVWQFLMRTVGAYFVDDGAKKSVSYLRKQDVMLDDELTIPVGKVIRVTVEYVDESETDPNGATFVEARASY